MLDDPTLTGIVRRARCLPCDGNGFVLTPAEDSRGESISGERDRVECASCGGNGILLGLCRRLAAEMNGRS